ncbi:MAG: MBL fold metallo-hydrolase, partial [Burkholderiales bacterium]
TCTTFAVTIFFAATPSLAQDAGGVLKRAATAMGANDLKTLRYAGRGAGGQFGQTYRPGNNWPKVDYPNYAREVDYDTVFTSERIVRQRAEPKGGGPLPLTGQAPSGSVANAQFSWNLAGQNAVPRQAPHANRLHDLWITPHGVLKAAAKSNAKLDFRNVGGRSMAAVSFGVPGVMTATALINENSLVERVESRMSDQVLGDITSVTTYSDYRDYNGVQFPTRIEQTVEGAPTMALVITDVQPNAKVESAVPDNIAKAVERATSEKVAEGVWFIAGGSHNSVVIEMADHVVLVESPLGDERAKVVFTETRKLVPTKPVRYVVNSHHHFDHSGGLRAAVAEGAIIVTQAQNKPYFERAFANASRVTPDALAKSGRKARVVGVGEQMIMKDATRTVEIHRLRDPLHVDTFLMVYLPKEHLLVEADAFTPRPPNSPAPSPADPYHVNLIDNISRLKLTVEQILPLHGRVVPVAELNRMVGK